MRSVVRTVLAVVAGSVVAGVVVAIIESFGHVIYPPPPGLDPSDREALRAAMENAPAGALVLVLIAWAGGTLAGGWVAARLAARSPLAHGLVVGAILLGGGLFNMIMIPHPAWFSVAGLLVFLPAAYLGVRLARPRGSA